MSVEVMIMTYGYPVVIAGALLEGETIVLTAGFLAHRGYMSLPLVILLAFIGGFAGDQLFFHVARKSGVPFLARSPLWKSRLGRVRLLLDRFGTLFVVGFRFLYGLRIATPVILGMTGYSARRFILLNAVGAILWAASVPATGYLLGHVLGLLVDIKKYEKWVAAGILAVGIVAWFINRIRIRKAKPVPTDAGETLTKSGENEINNSTKGGAV
jgi:membrane protein DedA with SNARE-associated domain